MEGDQTRLLYFQSEAEQLNCFNVLIREQGYESQFDQYRLLRMLGDGGSANVMLAQHKATSQKFAMKIMHTAGR